MSKQPAIQIPGLFRDEQTKMVVNQNLSDYHRLVAERANHENVATIRRDVDNLTVEINKLKSIIYELIK